MISFTLISALSTYYFIMFVTPGPNNAMLTASGMKYGFIRTLPHLIGIPTGHIIQISLVCFGLGNLFIQFPFVQFYLKILCFFYLLYLSWTILGSLSLSKKKSGRPLRLYEAALFQFINPKAWTIAITVVSAFFPSEENFYISTIFLTLTAALICFPSICIWAIFGNSLRLFINNTKTKKLIEYILAILLVVTASYILVK